MPGTFSQGYYTDDLGKYYNCRYQSATVIADVNPQPSDPDEGTVIQLIPASLRGPKNRFGLRARYISAVWNADPPAGYAPNIPFSIPIFTKVAYGNIVKGKTFQYRGAEALVVGLNNEHFGSG